MPGIRLGKWAILTQDAIRSRLFKWLFGRLVPLEDPCSEEVDGVHHPVMVATLVVALRRPSVENTIFSRQEG